jgi:hypothetical protein
MLTNQYVVNVLSDFVTLIVTVIAGATIYQLTRRRKLQSFFAISDKRIVVYLSNLNIPRGGALDDRRQRRTYQGGAIPVYEAQFIPIFYQLFNSPVPGLESQPGILSRLRFSDVAVEIQPAPASTNELERETTFVAVGSIGYNTASREVENRFNALATLDPNGFVVLPGNRPVGDSSFAVVQRSRDSSSGQSAFYVAGASMEGTTAAVGYLISKWRRLHKKYPKQQPFCVVLEALSADGRQYRQVFSLP